MGSFGALSSYIVRLVRTRPTEQKAYKFSPSKRVRIVLIFPFLRRNFPFSQSFWPKFTQTQISEVFRIMFFIILFVSFSSVLSSDPAHEIISVDLLLYSPPGDSSEMCTCVRKWHQMQQKLISSDSSELLLMHEHLLEKVCLELGSDRGEDGYFYVCVNIFGGKNM